MKRRFFPILLLVGWIGASLTEAASSSQEGVLTEALTAFKSEDYEKAEAKAQEAEKSQPKEVRATILRGRIALAQKRWEEADKHFSVALQKDPANQPLILYRDHSWEANAQAVLKAFR